MMNPDTYAYFALGMLSRIPPPLKPFVPRRITLPPRLHTKLNRAQPYGSFFQHDP